MKPSNKLHELAKNFEGMYLSAYPDPASPLGVACTRKQLHVTQYQQLANWKSLSGAPWTIGIGHTGTVNGKPVSAGMNITESTAYSLFDQDVYSAVVAVNRLVKVDLNQNQFDALVDFVFNLGQGNFASSTLLRKLNAGDYKGAANEFPRWNKAQGAVLLGLTKRRKAEQDLFLS